VENWSPRSLDDQNSLACGCVLSCARRDGYRKDCQSTCSYTLGVVSFGNIAVKIASESWRQCESSVIRSFLMFSLSSSNRCSRPYFAKTGWKIFATFFRRSIASKMGALLMPRVTSRLLERIARSYDHDAEWHDTDANLRKRLPY
jgi:hypothetical protein